MSTQLHLQAAPLLCNGNLLERYTVPTLLRPGYEKYEKTLFHPEDTKHRVKQRFGKAGRERQDQ